MRITTSVPFNLNFEQLAQQHPFNELPTKNRSADFLYWFCGTLADGKTKHGFDKKKSRKGYTSLCADYLRLIHQRYHQFMAYLFQAGVIEPDERTAKGLKCTGYKFTEQYSDKSLKEVEITDSILKRAIRRFWDKAAKDKMKKLRKCKHIYKWYLTHELTIDGEAAREWMNRYYEKGVEKITECNFCDAEKNKKEQALVNNCEKMLSFVEKIETDNYDESTFSVCDAGKRLHGMFTLNKSTLRNFTEYAGQPLIGIDVKNSQPYLSTLLLNIDFWRSKKVKTEIVQLHTIAPDIYKILREEGTVNSIIMLLKTSETLIQHEVSTARYLNLAVSGELYESLLIEMPRRLSAEFMAKHGWRVQTRDEIKKELLFIMYSENYPFDDLRLETIKVFEQMFPLVARIFRVVKGKGLGYVRFARILQRLESHLILQVVCKNLTAKWPQLPLFTIHDSITTTKGNEESVKVEIAETFTKRVGAAPNIKLEEWLPENAFKKQENYNYICKNDDYDEIEIM